MINIFVFDTYAHWLILSPCLHHWFFIVIFVPGFYWCLNFSTWWFASNSEITDFALFKCAACSIWKSWFSICRGSCTTVTLIYNGFFTQLILIVHLKKFGRIILPNSWNYDKSIINTHWKVPAFRIHILPFYRLMLFSFSNFMIWRSTSF